MFIDEVTVYLKAGRGGDGCASFRREKFIPKGGPDGGDGGKGGDIVLICDANQSDLNEYFLKKSWKAQTGEAGMRRQKAGKAGQDLTLRLPLGTVIYETQTQQPIAELTVDGEKIILLKGGKGGIGNVHFKSSIHQSPREFTYGDEGEEGYFRLEIKTIADIGLVGFPNAGKSSFMNAITDAHRKIAPYPFTTIHPSVGIIHYPETYERLILADIPGLIHGASQNRGLGHRFLRHIERCQVLLFMIDMAGIDGRHPWDDYRDLLNELKLYDPALLNKPRLIAANKIDEDISIEHLKTFQTMFPQIDIYPISCLLGDGIEALKARFKHYCQMRMG